MRTSLPPVRSHAPDNSPHASLVAWTHMLLSSPSTNIRACSQVHPWRHQCGPHAYPHPPPSPVSESPYRQSSLIARAGHLAHPIMQHKY